MALFVPPSVRASDANGNTLSGAKWYFYDTGTTDLADVYADAARTTPHTNPVVADSGGLFAPIYLAPDTTYRAILKTASGTTVQDIDPLDNLGASTGASEVGFIQSFPGAVARTVQSKAREIVSVLDAGAVGDGVADDRAACQAAIDGVSAAGGGSVFFPTGTYRLTKNPSYAYCLSLPSNVCLFGSGFATVLKRDDATDGAQVINCDTVENVRVSNLTIDGNRANNTSTGHGLRLGGEVRGMFDNLLIRNAHHYGIGIEAGANSGIKISDCFIEDCGGDGIDIKNLSDETLNYDGGTIAFAVGDIVTGATSGASGTVNAVSGTTASGTLTFDTGSMANDGTDITDFIDNENLQVGGVTRALANGTLGREMNQEIQISNLSVRAWGQDATQSTQAAVDCRGPVRITNLWVSDPVAADAMGLRFRQGEFLNVNGYGGHQSSASNVDIRMGTGASQYGVYVGARNCSVVGGNITGGKRGIYAIENTFKASNLRIDSASEAGVMLSSAGGLTADKAILTAVRSTTCGGDGFQVQTSNCELYGCEAESNTGYGLNTTAAANLTRVVGGLFATSNTAGMVNDSGTNSAFAQVSGYSRTYTVAQLATSITSPVKGQRAFVTDATATTFASTPTGGGSNNVPVIYDGAAWRIG